MGVSAGRRLDTHGSREAMASPLDSAEHELFLRVGKSEKPSTIDSSNSRNRVEKLTRDIDNGKIENDCAQQFYVSVLWYIDTFGTCLKLIPSHVVC